MTGDLHCHSTCSDGSVSPGQIGKYALRQGLTHIALTDHDTMDGVKQLMDNVKGTGLHVIPGVECTTRDASTGRPVHVLCYAPKNAEILFPVLRETSRRRKAAKLKMAAKLEKLYPVIRTEDILELSKGSASIFEAHLMRALANAGITNQPFGPLLSELIGKNGICYSPIEYPATLEVIDVMRKAGGIIVIAHPGQFDSVDLIQHLAKERMIDGIECYHYKNPESVTKICCEIAERYDLLVTGGSDFHGMYSTSPHPVGMYTTDEKNLLRLAEKADL